MRELRTAVIALVAISLAFGLAYPLAMTGVAQVVTRGRADGSLVKRDGKVVGSKLIGQDFSRDLSYFQSRPSATKYSASATFFNNQGPNQKALADQLRKNLRAYLRRERPHPTRARCRPTRSPRPPRASTRDISVANARIQAAPRRRAARPPPRPGPGAHRRRTRASRCSVSAARARSTCSSSTSPSTGRRRDDRSPRALAAAARHPRAGDAVVAAQARPAPGRPQPGHVRGRGRRRRDHA